MKQAHVDVNNILFISIFFASDSSSGFFSVPVQLGKSQSNATVILFTIYSIPKTIFHVTTSSGRWWSTLIPDSEMSKMDHSGKLILLFKILGHCGLFGDKLLVFSKSIITLDLIEEFLAKQYSDDKSEPGNCYLCRFLLFPPSK